VELSDVLSVLLQVFISGWSLLDGWREETVAVGSWLSFGSEKASCCQRIVVLTHNLTIVDQILSLFQ